LTFLSNALLAKIPESEYLRFKPHLKMVTLHKGQTLCEIGQPATNVYYPLSAIVSMLVDLTEGTSVEINIIGRTSMVGVAAVDGPSFYRATVRSTGLAYRMPTSTLKNEAKNCPVYTHAAHSIMCKLMAQMAQTMACGRHHSTENQIIRWLLITLDHTQNQVIKITQQEVADLLGFRREAVALALKKFVIRGDVELSRGQIKVLSRSTLEKISCDCYWIYQERKRTVRLGEAENSANVQMWKAT
jgi:CRP-like cAMP-binding protein